jgi:hypothetical protein
MAQLARWGRARPLDASNFAFTLERLASKILDDIPLAACSSSQARKAFIVADMLCVPIPRSLCSAIALPILLGSQLIPFGTGPCLGIVMHGEVEGQNEGRRTASSKRLPRPQYDRHSAQPPLRARLPSSQDHKNNGSPGNGMLDRHCARRRGHFANVWELAKKSWETSGCILLANKQDTIFVSLSTYNGIHLRRRAGPRDPHE